MLVCLLLEQKIVEYILQTERRESERREWSSRQKAEADPWADWSWGSSQDPRHSQSLLPCSICLFSAALATFYIIHVFVTFITCLLHHFTLNLFCEFFISYYSHLSFKWKCLPRAIKFTGAEILIFFSFIYFKHLVVGGHSINTCWNK